MQRYMLVQYNAVVMCLSISLSQVGCSIQTAKCRMMEADKTPILY